MKRPGSPSFLFSSCALLTIAMTMMGGKHSGADACTDILVTPAASVDGSAMIAYNADSPTLFGSIYHYPATKSAGNSASSTANANVNANKMRMRQVYDWDSGVYLGEIPEALETYNVVGNSNEHGLVIGESTFGGVAVLAWNQTSAIIDYGSLIYITLQRSKTVLEAIHTMVDLMDTYGYVSGGESFSLSDHSGDVWMMEVIGRGNDYDPDETGNPKKGAVWVALNIPNGSVAAHANQARITQFHRDDPEHCVYADDVIDVAVHYGLYSADADPADFSFSDVYHPVDFISARQGEARVWSIFSQIADDDGSFEREYQKYALGEDLEHRMPLYITPTRKLSAQDVMHLMTSHYEGTPMDSSVDVGAGLFGSPYRPRPLVWEYGDNKYHNERSIATPKTGWSFIAQIRPWMPPPLAAVMWYAMDDSSTAPRLPVYGCSRTISPPFAGQGSQDGIVTPVLQFSLEKAFFVQNMVSNLCYGRFQETYPLVRNKIDAIQTDFELQLKMVDETALQVYREQGPNAAIDHVTLFSVNAGMKLQELWMDFYGQLFVQFRDFWTIVPAADEPSCGCRAQEPGLSHAVKGRIVQETGNHYRVEESLSQDTTTAPPKTINGESWMGQVPSLSQPETSAKAKQPVVYLRQE
jgi:dipeptidase